MGLPLFLIQNPHKTIFITCRRIFQTSIMILSALICAFILCLVLYNFLGPDPAPIHGIYQQKGKWYHLKYWLMCVLFKLRQRQNKNKKQVDGKNAGWGMRSRNSIEDMDRAQVLPKEHPQAVDAVYFNAAD